MLTNDLRNFNINHVPKISSYPQGQAIVGQHHQVPNWQIIHK